MKMYGSSDYLRRTLLLTDLKITQLLHFIIIYIFFYDDPNCALKPRPSKVQQVISSLGELILDQYQ